MQQLGCLLSRRRLCSGGWWRLQLRGHYEFQEHHWCFPARLLRERRYTDRRAANADPNHSGFYRAAEAWEYNDFPLYRSQRVYAGCRYYGSSLLG